MKIPRKPQRVVALTGFIALLCVGLLFAALAASINTKPYMPPKVAQKYMEHWLIESARNVAGEVRLKHVQSIEPFYLRRDYQPVWMNSFELTEAGKELLQVLRETAADDWRNYGYELATLERETSRLSNIPKQATAVEVLLTDAFITYARQVLNAELLPDTGEGDHPSIRKVSATNQAGQFSEEQIVDLLNDSIRRNELDALVDMLTPSHPGYLRLRKELNRYLAIANSGDWYPLPDKLQLKPDDRHRLVPHLRWMLGQYGDLQKGTLSWLFKDAEERTRAPAEDEPHDLSRPEFQFDNALADALRHFQKRHQLPESGELDARTLTWLNIPPYQMAQKVALNMKRWRHLPRDLGQRHVMVNMADYRLQLMNSGSVELDMKVIIGNQQRRTPVMSQKISMLELAPTWSVPRRIAISSLLPKIRRNPGYLEEKGYQVIGRVDGVDQFISPYAINWNKVSANHFPYRLVQKAGDDNALGSIKFLFPNDKDIYLHDTSQPQLFNLDNRALSSGCVRVEKPRLLAEKLLRGQQGWNRHNIDAAIDQNRTTRIRLQEDVPVYLMYWTTWVDPNGVLQVREDVYNRDLIAGLPPTNPAVSL
ncbi:MAG: L,D-transpeptidase family protein [Saccharospirillaceae bacterium]|nr:L,D-transpeptidase family protein [Saccharospirillaceae bacterium]MCD8530226.1 L,D-transpeptidase family protein [Saccharospirillaceae bacterium]